MFGQWLFRKVPSSWRGESSTEDLRTALKTGAPIARITFTEPNPGLEFDYQPEPFIGVQGIAPSLDEYEIIGELKFSMIRPVQRIVIEAAGAGLLRR